MLEKHQPALGRHIEPARPKLDFWVRMALRKNLTPPCAEPTVIPNLPIISGLDSLSPGFAETFTHGFCVIQHNQQNQYILYMPSRRMPGSEIVKVGEYSSFYDMLFQRKKFLADIVRQSWPMTLGHDLGLKITYCNAGEDVVQSVEHDIHCKCCYCYTILKIKTLRTDCLMRFDDWVDGNCYLDDIPRTLCILNECIIQPQAGDPARGLDSVENVLREFNYIY